MAKYPTRFLSSPSFHACTLGILMAEIDKMKPYNHKSSEPPAEATALLPPSGYDPEPRDIPSAPESPDVPPDPERSASASWLPAALEAETLV